MFDVTSLIFIAFIGLVIFPAWAWLFSRITSKLFHDQLITSPSRVKWFSQDVSSLAGSGDIVFHGGAYESRLRCPWWLRFWNPQMFGFGINIAKLEISNDYIIYNFFRARHVFDKSNVALIVVELPLYGTWIRIMHDVKEIRELIAFRPKGHEAQNVVKELVSRGFKVGVAAHDYHAAAG